MKDETASEKVLRVFVPQYEASPPLESATTAAHKKPHDPRKPESCGLNPLLNNCSIDPTGNRTPIAGSKILCPNR